MTSLDPSNETTMIPRIGVLLARVTKNPTAAEKVSAKTDLVNEVGLDSLQMIDFLLGLEDEFGIEVDFDSLDMQHLTSVEALCSYVRNLQSSASALSDTPPLHKTAGEGA